MPPVRHTPTARCTESGQPRTTSDDLERLTPSAPACREGASGDERRAAGPCEPTDAGARFPTCPTLGYGLGQLVAVGHGTPRHTTRRRRCRRTGGRAVPAVDGIDRDHPFPNGASHRRNRPMSRLDHTSSPDTPPFGASRERFATELAARRVASGKSFAVLARELDHPRTTLHGWCRGDHLPFPRDVSVFERLLRAIDIDVLYL